MKRIIIFFMALFVLSGCTTFKVEDVSGIKSILGNKIEAEYLASEVKTKHTDSDKDKIMTLYEKAYLENNKWIAGIQLDIQSKNMLKVGQDDYSNHSAGLTSAQFISRATEFVGSEKRKFKSDDKKMSIEIPIGDQAAQFVVPIVNNIVELHNKQVGEARKRLYDELEKAKWTKWKEL